MSASTSLESVWIGRPSETSTMFGLMTTRLPRTSGGRLDRPTFPDGRAQGIRRRNPGRGRGRPGGEVRTGRLALAASAGRKPAARADRGPKLPAAGRSRAGSWLPAHRTAPRGPVRGWTVAQDQEASAVSKRFPGSLRRDCTPASRSASARAPSRPLSDTLSRRAGPRPGWPC